MIGGRLETVDSFWFWRNVKEPVGYRKRVMGNLESPSSISKNMRPAVRQYRGITVHVCMVPGRLCTEYLDLELE